MLTMWNFKLREINSNQVWHFSEPMTNSLPEQFFVFWGKITYIDWKYLIWNHQGVSQWREDHILYSYTIVYQREFQVMTIAWKMKVKLKVSTGEHQTLIAFILCTKFTCVWVGKHAWGDNVTTHAKILLHILLGHALGQATNIQVGPFNALTARSSDRDLHRVRKRRGKACSC